jgi:hypothetical protein
VIDRVAVICPSRERAGRIGACVDAFDDTHDGHADLFVCVDSDDPQVDQYGTAMGGRGILLVGPPMRCVPKLQWAWEMVKEYRVIGFIGDDTLARTVGWDVRMLNQATKMGGWAFLHPEDGASGERHMIHPFMTGNIPKALGVFAPKGYLHVFIDNYFDTLARRSGLHHFLPDVLFEHMHFSPGKAVEDATYARGNSREAWDVGQATYTAWVEGGLESDLAKIAAARGAGK